MTFFEDSPTPAAPLSGDASLFDNDLASQVNTTDERLVDTQSGFMFVIKHAGERLSLTCKRRVGTPPTSNILLTPDETLKLSRVFAASVAGRASATAAAPTAFPPLSVAGGKTSGASQVSGLVLVIVTLVVVAAAGAVAYGAASLVQARRSVAPHIEYRTTHPMDVEMFARTFVCQMLDFGPDTYRSSQVRAMSSMSRELMERYWKETNFPLPEAQLKKLPATAMVKIDRVQQSVVSPTKTVVDVYAQLVHSDSTSTPVHIKLDLLKDNAHGFRVIDQQDVTQQDEQRAPAQPASAPDTTTQKTTTQPAAHSR